MRNLGAPRPEFTVYLDGKAVLRRTDTQHAGGRVGLWVADTAGKVRLAQGHEPLGQFRFRAVHPVKRPGLALHS